MVVMAKRKGLRPTTGRTLKREALALPGAARSLADCSEGRPREIVPNVSSALIARLSGKLRQDLNDVEATPVVSQMPWFGTRLTCFSQQLLRNELARSSSASSTMTTHEKALSFSPD